VLTLLINQTDTDLHPSLDLEVHHSTTTIITGIYSLRWKCFAINHSDKSEKLKYDMGLVNGDKNRYNRMELIK
jgi:hypothetical protein